MRLTATPTAPAGQLTGEDTGLRALVAALLVLLLLVGFDTVALGLDHLGYARTVQSYGSGYSRGFGTILATILGSYLLLGTFLWFSFRSSPALRVVYFAIFAVAYLYEYGYSRALGRPSTPEDIVMAALFVDAGLYKDTALGYLNRLALLPIAGYGVALAVQRRSVRLPAGLARLVLLALLLSGFYSAMHLLTLANPQAAAPMPALSNFFRSSVAAGWKLSQEYHGPRETLAYRASTPPTTNVVLIVDESVRGDHLSLNGYGRPTTPLLDSLQARGVLHNWGIAASATTCSLGSNNLLLTGVTTLPDTEGRIRRQPSIFQYAKAMGYTTYYLDGGSPLLWNGISDDRRYIDHWEGADHFAAVAPYDIDRELARRLSQIAQTRGNFIWINKRGVHFHYNNAFPPDRVHWQPLLTEVAYDPSRHDEIVNSYDNALHYNLNGFFEILAQGSSVLDTSVVLYTSDHGQTLAEDGQRRTHCGETRNEALVPLFMLARYARPAAIVPASHSNIFATLLDLMGFPAEERPYDYAPSLLSRNLAPGPRRYYVGALDGAGRYYDFDPQEWWLHARRPPSAQVIP